MCTTHHIFTPTAKARGHKRVLGLAGMHEQGIDIAGFTEFERLARSNRDNVDPYAMVFFKDRNKLIQ